MEKHRPNTQNAYYSLGKIREVLSLNFFKMTFSQKHTCDWTQIRIFLIILLLVSGFVLLAGGPDALITWLSR